MTGDAMTSMMQQMMGPWWGFGPFWVGWLLNVLLLGGLIALVVVLMRQFTEWLPGWKGSGDGSRALEITKERYARGEIDKEEFEAKRRDLA